MSVRMNPSDVFRDWCSLLPRSDIRTRAELLQAFYDEQERALHNHNQQATIAGHRAQWAFREIRKARAAEARGGFDAER